VIGDDKKLILYFQGKDRGMVLNRTNSNNIAAAYGDEIDDWSGQDIVLFEAMVDFQGKTVPAIRVRPPQPKDRARNSPQAPAPKPSAADVLDDDIPF